MLAAIVHIHVLEQLGSQTILGEHALEHLQEQGVHTSLGAATLRLCHEFGGSAEALATGIAGIAHILVVGPLFAGHAHLVGVDNNHIVTTVYVRREVGLVLAAQQFCNLCAQTAQYLVGSIDNYPLFLDGCGVSRNGLVT